MYFISPSRHIPNLEQALSELPNLQLIYIDDIDLYDPSIIAIADIQDFLTHQWRFPTIVIAFDHEGHALAQAWEIGALAGWIWDKLPKDPIDSLLKIDAKYKRDQDSRDLPAAAELQQRLLPNPLRLENYQFETFFKPSAYLSGDWYDFWMLNEQEVIFYLADVSGHGVTSSLLTSWMAAFHGRSKTPKELILKLNTMLVQENIEKHITMIAGCLNLVSNQIRWCSAGHYPPPIVCETHTPPKILSTSSFPLGLVEELEVEEHMLTLNPDARFIICSDGALEPFDGGLNQQFQQLIDHLQNQSFKAPEHVADDIAILNIHRKD